MVLITKQVTLTEGQWRRVQENMERDDDWDAWKAVETAEVVSESTTYTRDAWLHDARKEGRDE